MLRGSLHQQFHVNVEFCNIFLHYISVRGFSLTPFRCHKNRYNNKKGANNKASLSAIINTRNKM